jgi:glycosyltransferase involved in cell wall biosynthesis
MSIEHQASVSGSESDVMIGIPAYNEERTIAKVVDEGHQHADTVLVVDDGSKDQTVERAKEAGAVVVEHERNKGYGGALQTIFDQAHQRAVDHLVIIDADGQHDPSEVTKLVDAQRTSGAQIVIGSRFVNGATTDAPLYRRAGIGVINTLTNAGLRFAYAIPRLTDTQSGFRVYDREAIETMSGEARLSEGMDASIDILFQAAEAGFEMVETPIEITYDVEDASTHHPLIQGLILLINILTRLYHDRPSRLLGIPGALFVITGGALAAAMLSDTPFAHTVPLVVVGLLLSVGGVLSGVAFMSGSQTKK